jgi:type II secretory pathway pseudopilin PulG
MGKRAVVLGAAVAVVALAVGAIGPAWGSASDKDKQRTFRLEALTTEQEFEGTALGDQIVFTTSCSGATARSGTRVGSAL